MKINLTLYRNEVVPVYLTDLGNKVVNARELHSYLGVNEKFSQWIRRKVKTHNFSENKDFTTYSEKTEKGRPTKEYIFLLDPSKKIAMGTNNAQGDKVKDYFLECERVAQKAIVPQSFGPSLEAHTKKEVQIENSKAAGALTFREEGLEGTKEYYKKTCKMASGLETFQVKQLAKQHKLKSKDSSSARAALRVLQPAAAATISFIDTAYRNGVSLTRVQPIAAKAKELYSDMIAVGMIPGELAV